MVTSRCDQVLLRNEGSLSDYQEIHLEPVKLPLVNIHQMNSTRLLQRLNNLVECLKYHLCLKSVMESDYQFGG